MPVEPGLIDANILVYALDADAEDKFQALAAKAEADREEYASNSSFGSFFSC